MTYMNNYKASFLLLIGTFIGGALGIIYPESSVITYPVGSIYLNFLYVLVIPLTFFSIVTSIISIKTMKKAKKILCLSALTFLILSLAASLLALLLGVTLSSRLAVDNSLVMKTLPQVNDKIDVSEKVIRMVSVKNITELFHSEHMIPLLLFSVLVAVSIRKLGIEGQPLNRFFYLASKLLYTMMSIIMTVAPIGFGCYFSYSIGQTGGEILKNYGKVFLLFLLFSLLFYFIFYSLVIYFSGGVDRVKQFWRFSMVPTVTAIATASSTACIPANLKACDQLNIDKDISRTIIPLGATIHKDGATGASVLKILLVLALCSIKYMDIPTLALVVLTAVLSGIVMGTVPGGGVSAAIVMISIFDLPSEMMSIIILLSTIFDIPATVLNSVGNIPSAIIVDHILAKKRGVADNDFINNECEN